MHIQGSYKTTYYIVYMYIVLIPVEYFYASSMGYRLGMNMNGIKWEKDKTAGNK